MSNDNESSQPKPTDPFDPARLRLSQDFAGELGAKKLLTTVPVRKPDKQAFVRVHPDANYRLNTAILEMKGEREIYLVDRSLWSGLGQEVYGATLFTAITRQGLLFLWPVRLPGSDGKISEWHRSAYAAADLATTKWVRVSANMNLGAYDIVESVAEVPEPQWPDLPFKQILEIAFKSRFIQTADHPVLRQLRGEA